MSPREHDPELRDLISGGDTLHEQLARLDRSEPPEELDRIVIERARQAIRTPQSERPIRQVRWAVPVGLAATLLISFGLVFHQVNTNPQQPAASPPLASTQERPADAYAPVAAQVREERADATAKVQARAEAFDRAVVAGTSAVEGDVSATENAAKERAAEPAARALADSAQRASAPAARAKTEAKADFRSDPDAWIAYIARLVHAGRSEEADRERAEFRRVFPKLKYAAPAGEAPVERPAEAIAPEK